MRNLKKITIFALAGAMCIGLLSGCTLTPPTAESLMEKPFKEEVKSADIDCKFAYEVTGKSDMEGMEMAMTVGISADINVLYDEDTVHAKGEVEAEIMGMSMSEEMETYSQKEKDKNLNYTKTDDTWYVSESESEDNENAFVGMLSFDIDKIKDLKLKEDKDSNVYTVTGKIAFKDLADNNDLEDLMSDMSEDIDTDDIMYHLTATFDKDNRTLKSVCYDVDMESIDNKDFEIDKMRIEITINKVNDVDVEVPKKVKENAIEEEYSDIFDITEDNEINTDESIDDSDATIKEETPKDESTETDKDNNTTEDSSAVKGDWTSRVCTFNGNKVTLKKTPVNDFVKTCGYKVVDDYVSYDTGYVVNPGQYVRVDLALEENDYSTLFSITAYNHTQKAIDIKECVLAAIDIDIEWCLDENISYKSMNVGGIELGKAADVKSILGTPENTYESKGGADYTYYTDDVYFVIEVNENGIVTGLQYDTEW